MTGRTSSLIVGEVVHTRGGSHRHRLRYRHCSWLFDLDELDELDRSLGSLFGVDRRRPFALRTASHLPLDVGDTLRERVESCLTRHERPSHSERVLLIANVATLGYGFDPVSWFCCYTADGALHTVIAEVHNTFGESHTYVIPAEHGLDEHGLDEHGWVRTRTSKMFHVSPFLSLDYEYELAARVPTLAPAIGHIDEQVAFTVTLRDDEGATRFVGLQRGARRPLTRGAVARELARSPLQSQLITARIHLRALRLWLRRAPLFRKPPFTPHRGSHHRRAA